MNEKRAILAVEDTLGEAVSIRILRSLGIVVSQRLDLNGLEYRPSQRSFQQLKTDSRAFENPLGSLHSFHSATFSQLSRSSVG